MQQVTCELRYCGTADAFLALAVSATLVIVTLAPFTEAVRALLVFWTIAGAAHARHKLRRVRALRLSADGSIVVHEAKRSRAGQVVPGSFVAPWLTIVHWRPEGARFARTLVLLPGMAGEAPMRNIRVILRWG